MKMNIVLQGLAEAISYDDVDRVGVQDGFYCVVLKDRVHEYPMNLVLRVEKFFEEPTVEEVGAEEPVMEIDEHGGKRWYLNGKLHREDGPAVEHANGTKSWYLNDNLHREDGPAIEWADGDKYWYLNDNLHREDGPAVEYSGGTKYWYLNGKKVTEEEVMGK